MTRLIPLLILLFAGLPLSVQAQRNKENDRSPKRPNILWLFQEDLSPWLGCYGYEIQQGHTPTIDAMAARGVRFDRAFAPAPVCSPCRSAVITGVYQIRFGAHEHRSRRGDAAIPLPDGMKTVPELLAEQGYVCFNVGKTDYNFQHGEIYQSIPKSQQSAPWLACPQDQPFFGQIQLKGGKLNTSKFKDKTDRSKVTIPADYPQNELYREVVAEHFDSARMDDVNIKGILDRLDRDGLTDSTIVVYFSDHGANHLVRHKQQPTEGGSHVPLIISGPNPWVPAPSVRSDLVSLIDISATTLVWGGAEVPSWMEGQDLFADAVVPREFVATARDRCDHTIERIRSIRTDRFRYTRNYLLDRVLLQPQYRDRQPYVKDLREAYAKGSLAPELSEIYFGPRPAEELYDVQRDPAQLNNLVEDPEYLDVLKRHRALLDQWLAKGDRGAEEEPKIELEMASNRKWGTGVNPEYEAIREDSDGDGLSDTWEQLNDRDPNDGKLEFRFDCGGWQTEGWHVQQQGMAITGSQGALEFTIGKGSITLLREGLNAPAPTNSGPFVARVKADVDLTLRLSMNGRAAQSFGKIKGDQQWQEVELMPPTVDGPIRQLALQVQAETEGKLTIDWLKAGSVK